MLLTERFTIYVLHFVYKYEMGAHSVHGTAWNRCKFCSLVRSFAFLVDSLYRSVFGRFFELTDSDRLSDLNWESTDASAGSRAERGILFITLLALQAVDVS